MSHDWWVLGAFVAWSVGMIVGFGMNAPLVAVALFALSGLACFLYYRAELHR